jgi:MFS family permease
MISINLNKKVIIFGFIFTFFSCFGQSFFLGLFNPSIRSELNIGQGQFGTIYALATLCSSLVIIWFGKKIDEIQLFYYSFIVVALLFVSSTFFSIINNTYLLFVGIFLLRFSGQGLMIHTGATAISRYFNKSRGKALSAIWFGLSSAEFIMPVLITFFLSLYSWRILWQGISILIIIILPLTIYSTIKFINFESREVKKNLNQDLSSIKKIKNWTRKEVIFDLKFYVITLTMQVLPTISTGIFVYQSFISESKNWGTFIFAQSFMAYSVASLITLFGTGFLVDKFSSRKLIPFMNIPLIFALIVLVFFDHPYTAFIFLGLCGISNGIGNVLGASTWAELYGVRYIGSIKALTTAIMVFSTAFGTAIFGVLIDQGFSIERIALTSSGYIVLVTILLLMFRKSFVPKYLSE